jgi:hypothetical protein
MERACWRDSALRVLLYAPGCRLDGVERSTAIAGVRVSFSCISYLSLEPSLLYRLGDVSVVSRVAAGLARHEKIETVSGTDFGSLLFV